MSSSSSSSSSEAAQALVQRIEAGAFTSFILVMLSSFAQGGYPGGYYNGELAVMGIFLASKLEGKFVLMYTGLLSLSLLFDQGLI